MNIIYKVNEKVNRFSLAGNKFVPEMHLRHPGFTYIACETLSKKKKEYKNLKKRAIHKTFVKTN